MDDNIFDHLEESFLKFSGNKDEFDKIVEDSSV